MLTTGWFGYGYYVCSCAVELLLFSSSKNHANASNCHVARPLILLLPFLSFCSPHTSDGTHVWAVPLPVLLLTRMCIAHDILSLICSYSAPGIRNQAEQVSWMSPSFPVRLLISTLLVSLCRETNLPSTSVHHVVCKKWCTPFCQDEKWDAKKRDAHTQITFVWTLVTFFRFCSPFFSLSFTCNGECIVTNSLICCTTHKIGNVMQEMHHSLLRQ